MRVSSFPIILALGLTACSGGGGETATPTPTATVTANRIPTISVAIPDQAANVGFSYSFDASQAGTTFADADGNTLSFAVAFSPAGNGLTATGAQVSGVPNQTGNITISVTASDGNGGSIADSFVLAVTAEQSAIQTLFAGSIDLNNLANYANQTVPNYIDKLDTGGNPITDAGATLGRVLFYDKALSSNNTVSCASCHTQALGFSDARVTSVGLNGGQTGRHSMRLINTQFATERDFFWDERAASHEAQETQPVRDEVEMGFSGINNQPNFSEVLTKLEALEYYQELFRFVYHDEVITEERIQNSIAQFVKSIQSFDSKYDVGRAQVNNNNANFPNFTAQENAGKTLFADAPNDGGAGCNACHRAPEFDIDANTDNNGVLTVANNPTGVDTTNTRAPTLRDLVNTSGGSNGPFMHDGSLATLRDVINHYNAIPVNSNDPNFAAIDNRLRVGNNPQRLNLTEAEKDSLEAFLKTLSGTSIYTDTKLSDPF